MLTNGVRVCITVCMGFSNFGVRISQRCTGVMF